MDIVEQLERLAELREKGAISDEEFAAAKQRIIDGEEPKSPGLKLPPVGPDPRPQPSYPPVGNPNSLGHAANRWVSLQIVMAIVGIIIFLIMGSTMCSKMNQFERSWIQEPSITIPPPPK